MVRLTELACRFNNSECIDFADYFYNNFAKYCVEYQAGTAICQPEYVFFRLRFALELIIPDFWHGHQGCGHPIILQTDPGFRISGIAKNKQILDLGTWK